MSIHIICKTAPPSSGRDLLRGLFLVRFDVARRITLDENAVPNDLTHEGDYIRISSPQTSIQFTKLPDEIQNLLRGHIVSVDVAKEKYIRIEHAYG